MKRFIELSIKKKLILIIFSVAILALIIAFTIITILNYNRSRELLKNDARINARLIAEYSFTPIMFEDINGLHSIIKKAETLPNVCCAAVYDNYGNLLSSYKRDKRVIIPPYSHKTTTVYENAYIKIIEEISYNEKKYGQLILVVSTEEMKRDFLASWIYLIFVVIGMGVLVYILAVKFQRLISVPVIQLSKTAREISDKQDYSVRLEKKTNDEIGELYDSFNTMIERIQKQMIENRIAHENTLEQYERFLAILNAFPDSVYISDPGNYEILFANSAMKSMFQSDLTGRKCYEVLMNEKEPCGFCILKNLKTIDKIVVREQYSKIIKKHLQITDKLIRWPDGRIVRLQQLRDITQRKKAEEKLREYKENLEILVEERTAELKKANGNLEKSMQEVVKMNKLFVGREFRIKELRDEIKELKSKNK